MGYYANGYGHITAKDAESYKKIRNMFGYIPGTNETPFDFWEHEDELTIDISNDDKYYEDEVDDFLTSITEFITEGEVEYVGEDGCHWKYVFDFESSCWHERNGRIIYDLSELSDDELCTELQKRGYTVQKVMLSDYINS